jgi:hypothetical protein
VPFAALIADKAFDSNAIIAKLNARGAKIVFSQHPRRLLSRSTRRCTGRHPDRELLLQAQGVQMHRHARRQPDASFAAMIHIAVAVIDSR